MVVQPVLHQNISQVWGLVEQYIAKALKFAKGDYNEEHAKVYLTNGSWQLFVAVDDANTVHGACTVEFINRPNDRIAFVTAIGGKFISDPDTFGNFKESLKSYGATKIEGAARPSIKRLWESKLGFSEKYSIVETEI